MKYILVDDDLIVRETTLQYLRLIPNCTCLGAFSNAFDASKAMQKEMPDVLLLDIEMPQISGLQFAKSLVNIPFVIFISAHPHYAAEAFEVDAIDYLVKPIAPERLSRAMEKVRHLIELKASIPEKEGFNQADDASFFIKEKNAFVRIYMDDVVYIESLADFVNIYLKTGEKKIALVNLKNLEQQLPSHSFIRVSRSHIVNKHKITSLDTTAVSLDRIQLPIGKTFVQAVMQDILGKSVIKRHS